MRTPPREGEVAALSDLSADARRSSASFHALKRGRDVEEGDESSESLHGGPTMKRSGSLRDLGMANHMSGVPMTKSGLSGCLDDMGLSGLGDSPHVHARKASQVHDLATVPGSPASRPTGEDLLIMPKIDSVLSLPSASPSHADRATRTLSEESMVEGEKPRSVNDDDSRELLAVQRTALECSLAKYGLSLAPCTTFDSAPEALEAPTSPRLDASRALRAKLTPEGSRRVEMSPEGSRAGTNLGSCELSPSDWNSALAEARAEACRAPMSPILRSLSERDIYSRVRPSAEVLAQEPSPGVSQVKAGFVRVVGGFT